jgi:hypothetical protein
MVGGGGDVKSPPAPNGTQNHCASSPCVPGVRRFSLILLRFRGGVARALRRLVGWRVEGSGERAGGWLAACLPRRVPAVRRSFFKGGGRTDGSMSDAAHGAHETHTEMGRQASGGAKGSGQDVCRRRGT